MAFIKNIFDKNFLEYASYVIKDRAIPDIEDGLRRLLILWDDVCSIIPTETLPSGPL